MKKTSGLLSAISIVALATAASAQEVPVRDLPVPAGAQFRIGDFQEPFRDPGNETAKALAAVEGISVGEATRRLRLQHNAARLESRLRQQHPDTFAGVIVPPGSSRVVVRFSGTEAAGGLDRVRQATDDAELLGAVAVERVPRSQRENLARGEAVGRSVQQLGLRADIAVDPSTGDTKILARDPQAVRAAIQQGRLAVPEGTAVEQFEGITPTADIHAGRSQNGDTGQGCTTGFVVQNRTTGQVGISTAGHCDNRSRYSLTRTSDYNSGGTALTFQAEWEGARADGYAQDVQWHTASTLDNQFPVKYFNGTSYVFVTAVQEATIGTSVCRYGRKTNQTCGPIDQYVYRTVAPNGTTTGWFSRANKSATYPTMNDVGDSGGPVYRGGGAAGIVHGKDNLGNLYFMPLRSFEGLPIGVMVCASGC